MICGNMNATAEFGRSFVGGRSCSISNANDNGERFSNFLNLNELSLANTWFQHKEKHKHTWYSNTGTFSKTIDYISMSKWLMQYAVDCRLSTSFTFNNSDHRIRICCMQTPRRKVDRNHFVKPKPKSNSQKFDMGSLKDEYVRSNFTLKVDTLCHSINAINVGVKECEQLVNILEKAAKHTLPNAVKSIESRIWDNDEELKRLLNIRDQIDRTSQKEKHKSLTKHICTRFDQLRITYSISQTK